MATPSFRTLQEQLLATLSEKLSHQGKASSRPWHPYPWQVPPDPTDAGWDTWLILAGRGAGKTRTGAQYVLDHLRAAGKAARVGCGGVTQADARDVQAEGESGLISIAPDEFRYNRSLGEAFHEGGGYVKFLGSEEPARWNGPQWSLLWWDELALANEESWHQSQFGLRLGAHPRTIVTTTPKARKFVRDLAGHPRTVVTRATTYDNPALPGVVLSKLTERYGGTTLGRQELLAEWVDDVEGAYWHRTWIDRTRLEELPEDIDMRRVVVAVDPATTMKDESCETGLCVAGAGTDGRLYVLDSRGVRASPEQWARLTVALYEHYRADRVVAEVNSGGDMVVSTLRNVDASLPIHRLTASRGKIIRAEPISALYEQGRVSHIGHFPDLEEQMCVFPVVEDALRDRLDALVWALTELAGGAVMLRRGRRVLVVRGGEAESRPWGDLDQPASPLLALPPPRW